MSLVASPDIMYRLLIQSVVDYAFYLLTPEGIVANWNPGAQRAKGYLAEEIVGKHYSLFYTDAERAAGLPALNLEQARSTGRFEEIGSRLRKDGTVFHAHVVIDAVYDDAGQLVGFAKVTRDISERHRQELELLQAKELAEQYSQEMAKLSQFLDSVIANIPASVIVQDLESQRILLANQQAERLFGGPQRSMIGSCPASAWHRALPFTWNSNWPVAPAAPRGTPPKPGSTRPVAHAPCAAAPCLARTVKARPTMCCSLPKMPPKSWPPTRRSTTWRTTMR